MSVRACVCVRVYVSVLVPHLRMRNTRLCVHASVCACVCVRVLVSVLVPHLRMCYTRLCVHVSACAGASFEDV